MTEGLIGFFVRRGRDVGFFQRGHHLRAEWPIAALDRWILHRPVTLQHKAHRAFLPLPGGRLVYVSEDSRLDPCQLA